MTQLSTSVFDYGQVDADTKGKLVYLAGQAKQKHVTFRESGLRIGEVMAEAHSMLGTRLFESWVLAETDVGLTTAYNCKNVFEASKTSKLFEQIPLSVGYVLASPKVPKEAIQEIERAVAKGQKPSISMAKQIVKKHRPTNPASIPVLEAYIPAFGAPPPPPDPTICLKDDGQHRWTDDVHNPGEMVCSKCGEPRNAATSPGWGDPKPPEPEPLDDSEVGKKLAKLNDMIGQMIRLCDEVRPSLPTSEYDTIYSSLELVCQELHQWRKKWQKTRAAG